MEEIKEYIKRKVNENFITESQGYEAWFYYLSLVEYDMYAKRDKTFKSLVVDFVHELHKNNIN